MSGTIPEELGSLYGLGILKLDGNSLTGTIPEAFEGLTDLTEVKLAGNSLTGCIPWGLKDVATNDLSSLNLSYCPPVLAAPAVGTAGEFSLPLTWTAPSGVSKYRVEYRKTRGPRTWTVASDTIASGTYSLDGLQCETSFDVRVSAYGDGTTYAAAWSEPSELVSASTSACVTPVFDAASYTFSIPHDASVGTVVGTVSATDPDGETLTYSITAGNEDGKFAIGAGGAVTLAAALDHETAARYALTVQAADLREKSGSATVNIAVTDVNEAPSFGEDDYAFTVAEDAAVGASVGSVSATNLDEDVLTYSITAGDSSGQFSVDADGAVTVAKALDYETTASYTLTLQASDGNGESATTDVAVSVTDVNESPSFDKTEYAFTVAEDAAVGASVGTAPATDPDEDSLTYSITAGDGSGQFSIDGSGAITVAKALDYETTTSYTLTLAVSDGRGGTAEASASVTVSNVADTLPPRRAA